MLQKITLTFMIGCMLILAWLPAQAASGVSAPSAWDLLAAVNSLRAANGLPAYQADGALMAAAQGHSEYQASIGTWSHQGAGGSYEWDRAAAAGYGGGASIHCDEAVAIAGTAMGVDYVVNTLWADYDHRVLVLLNASYLHAGAGAVEKDGMVYYTLDACYTGAGAGNNNTTASKAPANTVQQPTATREVIESVVTSTPMPDGSVIHEVQPGQALWSIAIAYGIKIADIAALNKLDANNPVVFIGDKLVVRGTSTVTLTPTETSTLVPVTRTPTRTRTPRLTLPTRTVTPLPSETPKPLIPTLPPLPERTEQMLGYGLIAVCGLGLLLVILTGFRKK